MAHWLDDKRFKCPRCGRRVYEFHYWDNGYFECVCTRCKEEMESGQPRKFTRKEADPCLLI